MPLDTSSMSEKERKKFENLTWTAMRYMREKGMAELDAKITGVHQEDMLDGNVRITFRVVWVDKMNSVCVKKAVIDRNTLLAYHRELLSRVGAIGGDMATPVDDADEVSAPVSMPPRSRPAMPSRPKPPPVVVPITTWSTERARLRGTSIDLTRRLVTKDGALGCRCSASVRPGATTCDHVRLGYLTGRDNEVLDYQALLKRPSVGYITKVPIGMGHHWTKATITSTPDQKHLAVISGLDALVCRELGWTSDGFFLELDEGLIGYIQYLEDLISQVYHYTRLSEGLEAAPSTINPDAVTCSMVHATTQRAAIIAATQPTNSDRNNWLLANAAQIIDSDGKMCLACAKLEIGKNDVPDI